MAFNFDHFFGYESQINTKPDLVLIYGFAGIMFGIVGLMLLSIIFRKIGLTLLTSQFINPLVLSFGLCLLVSIFPTLVFKIVANNLSGVKLIYIWITILAGITFFTFLNYQMIRKFVYSFGNRKD